MFNNEKWHMVKIHKAIWEALLDHGRVAWDRCLKSIKLSPSTERKLLEARNHVVCVKLENYVRWCYDGLPRGFIS